MSAWTTEKPTTEGWYWLRGTGVKNPDCFMVVHLVMFQGFLVDEYTMDSPEDGEWQPVEPAKE